MTWEENYLAHFGIKGQQWGVRRFQNEDGTLTEEGKKRYLKNTSPEGVEYYSREAANLFDKVSEELQISPKATAIYDKYAEYGGGGILTYDPSKKHNLQAHMDYAKEFSVVYKEIYREMLAKDIGADPDTLKGQKWLDELLYYDYFDDYYKQAKEDLKKLG